MMSGIALRPMVVLFAILIMSPICQASKWRVLAPGIEYIDLGASLLTPWSHVHVFRIDLKENKFDLVMAASLSKKHASINEFARHSKALLTFNGGFFDQKYRPLGLRIGQNTEKNPLKRISWWGIFYIKNQKAYLTNIRHFRPDQQIDFALQSGPRLIINGKIPSLKAGVAERSALGITEEGKVIVLVTDNTPMSTTTLAKTLKSVPLNCTEALNLDGGSSTQLNANIDAFQLNVHGLSNVSDAVVIKPRKSS